MNVVVVLEQRGANRMNFWIIFFTGLTTGGLSCLAVQGGLLTSAMTRQISVPAPETHKARKRRQKEHRPPPMQTSIQISTDPWPVVYFLVAKLAAYTLLGALLGMLGSVLQITPRVQAIMQILAAIFMLGTALNMFNVHPIFRYFALQPPKALTRLVRNQSKSQEVFTPALLGLLTILIPCGTTQAMEALAITTSNVFLGALVMFCFVLGTSPTFFVLGFLATKIRGRFQKVLAVTAALLIMLLSFVSFDSALNLLGVPSPSRVVAAILQTNGLIKAPGSSRAAATFVNGRQEVTINALANGYQPNYITARSGEPIRLKLKTNNVFSCTLQFVVPSQGVRQFLPQNSETIIDLPPQPPGTLNFTCGMGMYGGVIEVQDSPRT